MRSSLIIVVTAILFTSLTHAAEPTTKPTVLLLRFAQLNDAAGTEWIGRVVQESLLTDTARIKSVRVISSQQSPTTDPATARQLARDAKADFVVLGGYQTVADNLKITGQVMHVESGEMVGTLKSTATLRDVIAMEETLGRQLERSFTQKQTQIDDPPVAKAEIETLGPVRLANYTTTFAPPKSDPHQQFKDRYTYGLPAYSPYFNYGCGFPYYYYSPCYNGCGASFITPASIFYGD